MTVCPPNSGKWSFLVEGLSKFDTKGLIFDTIRKYNEKDDGKILRYSFLQSIIGSTKKSKRKVLMDQFDPNLILDHSLPKRLDLLPIEKETFYLLHFACYSAGKRCIQEIIRQVTNVSKNSMDSIIANDTREETSEIIKNTLCENQNTNCSIMKKDSWMNCLDLDQQNKSVYKGWCNDCSNLSSCLPVSDEDFILPIVHLFYSWRKYINKKSLIGSLMHCLLDPDFSYNCKHLSYFAKDMGMYIKSIKPYPNSDLTLLDAWYYASGTENSNDKRAILEDYFDNMPTSVLKDCSANKTKESCSVVDKLGKEIWRNTTWIDLYQDLFDEFIPFCSYATKAMEISICSAFRKSKLKIQQEPCFTFSNSLMIPELGPTQGLNFLVNYDYPGTPSEMSQPATIILHEQGTTPDIRNIKGENFFVNPGSLVNLKISTTIVESTDDFVTMPFEDRLCSKNYGEIDCINEKLINIATSECECSPRYANDSINVPCDTLGMICYEQAIQKSEMDHDITGSCYPACKRIKYLLKEAEKYPMTDTIPNFESYGYDYINYFHNNLLGDPRSSFGDMNKFLEFKLKKTSLIHINFDEAEVWTMKKDAKATLANMIGNIGGTLGVFIGFSFVGLLKSMIDFFLYLHGQAADLLTSRNGNKIVKNNP